MQVRVYSEGVSYDVIGHLHEATQSWVTSEQRYEWDPAVFEVQEIRYAGYSAPAPLTSKEQEAIVFLAERQAIGRSV
jgi:hypothetical protein